MCSHVVRSISTVGIQSDCMLAQLAKVATELHILGGGGKLDWCGVEDSGGIAIRLPRLHGVVAQVRSVYVGGVYMGGWFVLMCLGDLS